MKEHVNHPDHYGGKDNPYEVIKVIEAWGLNFNLGNTVKYIARTGKKDTPIQELKKARWYLDREISNIEAELVRNDIDDFDISKFTVKVDPCENVRVRNCDNDTSNMMLHVPPEYFVGPDFFEATIPGYHLAMNWMRNHGIWSDDYIKGQTNIEWVVKAANDCRDRLKHHREVIIEKYAGIGKAFFMQGNEAAMVEIRELQQYILENGLAVTNNFEVTYMPKLTP